jgi:phosphatidylinositol alpha-mannosyltransferase
MRIVHVLPYSMTRPGGVQTHVQDLCAWLERQGHAARIVAPPPGDPAQIPPLRPVGHARQMRLHGTGFELSYAPRAARKGILRDLRDWGADVLHLHTPWVPALPWQIWRGLRLPTVATFHATLPDPPTDIASRLLLRSAAWMARRLDAVIVPSEVPRRQWAGHGITPLPHVLPPAIDLTLWGDAGADRAAPTGPLRRAICVGRLEGRKGIDTLLDAWRLAAADLGDAELVLAGRGTPPALPSGVTVWPDAETTDLRRAVAAADVLIAPAGFGESYGLALAEAMAAGTPVLAAANPAYCALLGPEGAAAQTVPAGDVAALAGRLRMLSQNPQMRADWSARGRARAVLSDVAHVGPAYLSLYESVMAARSKRDARG